MNQHVGQQRSEIRLMRRWLWELGRSLCVLGERHLTNHLTASCSSGWLCSLRFFYFLKMTQDTQCISHAGYWIPWFCPSHTEIWWWRAVETGLKHAAWMHVGYAGYIVQSRRMSHIDGNVNMLNLSRLCMNSRWKATACWSGYLPLV